MSKALNKQRQLATSALRGKHSRGRDVQKGRRDSSNYQHERVALIRFVLWTCGKFVAWKYGIYFLIYSSIQFRIAFCIDFRDKLYVVNCESVQKVHSKEKGP